jgi:hypothetical protein
LCAHHTVASNKSPAMDAAAAAADGKERDDKKQEEKDAGKVSFTGLFRYTDDTDVLLMLVGTVAAMANGVSQPLMTLIMARLSTPLVRPQTTTSSAVSTT